MGFPPCSRQVAICWLALLAVRSAAAEVDVYLLGGQSNMQGNARLADLPADVPRKPADTFFWTGAAFEPLVVGTTRTSARPGEFGPEIGLAAALPANGRRHYLVKYAASGMPLHHGWNAASWVGDPPGPKRRTFYPGERPDDPNQGTLYRDMLARFRAGIAALGERGDTPVVRGFAWMQGEADAKHEQSATEYAASLRRLRDRLAADLSLDALPLVYGQVLPHEPAMARFTHRREIRDAMAAADERSGRPEAIPLARMVPTEGCGLSSDTVHYDAAGQLRLGRAFGDALSALHRPGGR